MREQTPGLHLILSGSSKEEVGGISEVAVKCIDITKNTDREGSLPDCN